ncbi:hypothetical protein R50073_01360 [Maricurvus nonylphenolicus]|uniref:pyridoxamine 5'-phosphate oxidase family protein n=1 Tax=Maricurvus nonylphenolicus TaxID=1008307 RepID=UPI0036F1F186
MSVQHHFIHTLEQLRQVIPAPPAMLAKRILPALDAYCQNLISKSCLVAVGSFSAAESPASAVTLIALKQETLKITSESMIDIVLDNTADFDTHSQARPVSLYFFMPGIGYGLRVNGILTVIKSGDGYRLNVVVTAAYLQCSRAKVRAGFWQSHYPQCEVFNDPKAFLASSSYGLMLTQNAEGETELSPRGDPAGFARWLDNESLVLPERPGNKVAVSLRNILQDNTIRLLFFIPGSTQILQVSGLASVSRDPQLLATMAINNKSPKLAIVIAGVKASLSVSPALETSQLWNSTSFLNEKSLPSFAKMMGEHMSGKGIKGKLSSALVDVVVKKDLKNLY